ncbi:hypothetical protein Tco_1089110 [Tanacetum coccineum]
MFESGSYRSQPEHAALYDALEASMDHENREEFIKTTAKSCKRRHDDQDPPPPPSKDSDQSKKKGHDSDVSASKQCQAQTSSAWKTSDINSEDTSAAHLPKIKTRPDWLKPANAIANAYKDLEENKLIRKTGDMGSFIKWYCKQIGKSKLKKADLEGPAFKLVRPFHKNIISLQFQMEECHLLLIDKIDLVNPEGNRVVPDVSKPLPLGGPPGQVTIQPQYFFNKDLEYLVSGDKEIRNALSISKLKAAYYPDFRLEELVLSLWNESEREYDISAPTVSHTGGLSARNSTSQDTVPPLIVLQADYKEYKISEADFKNLHPNDFEDLYLLHLQGNLNYLCGADKLSLTQPSYDAFDFLFKEDYTTVHKPRAVIYRDWNNQKKMMRESEVHKFSDGTLTRILEKLDHMVKDFVLFKFNPGIENRIWSKYDKMRSKEFIEVIERRLKISRIFRSLKSFVSGRLRDVDYRLIQRTE